MRVQAHMSRRNARYAVVSHGVCCAVCCRCAVAGPTAGPCLGGSANSCTRAMQHRTRVPVSSLSCVMLEVLQCPIAVGLRGTPGIRSCRFSTKWEMPNSLNQPGVQYKVEGPPRGVPNHIRIRPPLQGTALVFNEVGA